MPVIEEIDPEDIDNLDMDIEEFDPANDFTIDSHTPLPGFERAAPQPSAASSRSSASNASNASAATYANSRREIPENNADFSDEQYEILKQFPVLYPCYFDKNRSHKEGRRVSEADAVENPLGKTVLDAVLSLGLHGLLETEKCHPQDWGNPGRVRVFLKSEGVLLNRQIPNKRRLMHLVAQYLKAHPTTKESPMKFAPAPELKQIKPRDVQKPRGFKMNTIIPVFSPAVQGLPMTEGLYKEMPKPVAPKKPKMKREFIRA